MQKPEHNTLTPPSPKSRPSTTWRAVVGYRSIRVVCCWRSMCRPWRGPRLSRERCVWRLWTRFVRSWRWCDRICSRWRQRGLSPFQLGPVGVHAWECVASACVSSACVSVSVEISCVCVCVVCARVCTWVCLCAYLVMRLAASVSIATVRVAVRMCV